MVNYSNLCKKSGGSQLVTNRLKEVREDLLISKSELAKMAGISHLTIARVEKGVACRQETKRKILAALGLKPSEKEQIFP
ncbi:MAG: helix-turn-helix transcriptional regulator [Deltaproteobacteria bacterium]|nr:helix-turn-helix transcriptional regulator [Deltaproteobacteria bacterium]